MKVIGILQLILGSTGIIVGSFMVGDIGVAAIIGAVSALLSGIGFLLPEKNTIRMPRSKKMKYSIIIASSCTILLLAAVLLISSQSDHVVSRDKLLTSAQFEQLFTDAKPLRGYQVDFYGRVFKTPDRADKYLSFQVYAQNDDRKSALVRLNNTAANIQEDDILHIVGEVYDMYEGKNIFGATIKVPMIVAKKAEKTDYMTAFAPAIRTIEVNQTQEQNGYIMTVSKVEIATAETRVYLKINNKSADTINFINYSSAVIQDGKQYKRIDNSQAHYPKINSDNIHQGVTTEGVIVFQTVDLTGDNFSVTFEGSSDNWKIHTDPFTFEIPLKHEIILKPSNPKPSTESAELNGKIRDDTSEKKNSTGNGNPSSELPPPPILTGQHHYIDTNNPLNEVSVSITGNNAEGTININTTRDKTSLIEFSGEIKDGSLHASFKDDGWGESGTILLSLSKASAKLKITVKDNADSTGWGVSNSSYSFESK